MHTGVGSKEWLTSERPGNFVNVPEYTVCRDVMLCSIIKPLGQSIKQEKLHTETREYLLFLFTEPWEQVQILFLSPIR
jgi:hypothetical protein